MRPSDCPYQSDFARRHWEAGRFLGYAEVRLERLQGRPEPVAEFLRELETEPLTELGAEVIVNVLEARHVTVTEEARERIAGRTDVRRLITWAE